MTRKVSGSIITRKHAVVKDAENATTARNLKIKGNLKMRNKNEHVRSMCAIERDAMKKLYPAAQSKTPNADAKRAKTHKGLSAIAYAIELQKINREFGSIG